MYRSSRIIYLVGALSLVFIFVVGLLLPADAFANSCVCTLVIDRPQDYAESPNWTACELQYDDFELTSVNSNNFVAAVAAKIDADCENNGPDIGGFNLVPIGPLGGQSDNTTEANCNNSLSLSSSGGPPHYSATVNNCRWGNPMTEQPSTDSSSNKVTIINEYEGTAFSLPDLTPIRQRQVSAENPQELIGRGLRFFTGLFGSIALVMIIYGGLQVMFASGQGDKVKSGFKIIIWAGIGLVTMMLSYLLVDFILGAIV